MTWDLIQNIMIILLVLWQLITIRDIRRNFQTTTRAIIEQRKTTRRSR